MTPAQRMRRPVVISSFDLPDVQELLLHGCENGACAVSDDRSLPTPSVLPSAVGDSSRWVFGCETVDRPLNADHQLLFNPESPEFHGGKVLTAWLHVTIACNLRCPYCYMHKSAAGTDESAGLAAVLAVIKSAFAYGFLAVKLKYTGGEASVNHPLQRGRSQLSNVADRYRKGFAQIAQGYVGPFGTTAIASEFKTSGELIWKTCITDRWHQLDRPGRGHGSRIQRPRRSIVLKLRFCRLDSHQDCMTPQKIRGRPPVSAGGRPTPRNPVEGVRTRHEDKAS
jgi:hypothetical protein